MKNLIISLLTIFLFSSSLTAVASENTIIEWVQFKAKKGVSDKQLLDARSTVIKHFMSKQRGLESIELLKNKDGTWVDVARWKTKTDAENAAHAAFQSDICLAYFSLIQGVNGKEPVPLHFKTIRSLIM